LSIIDSLINYTSPLFWRGSECSGASCPRS